MIIPYFSQDYDALISELSPEEARFWSTNSCGIICVRIAIAALTGTTVPLQELIAFREKKYTFIDTIKTGEEKELPLFDEKNGWLNY